MSLGPLALAFLGVSDKKTVAEVQKLERAYGDAWVAEWLSRRGLSLNDFIDSEREPERLVAV